MKKLIKGQIVRILGVDGAVCDSKYIGELGIVYDHSEGYVDVILDKLNYCFRENDVELSDAFRLVLKDSDTKKDGMVIEFNYDEKYLNGKFDVLSIQVGEDSVALTKDDMDKLYFHLEKMKDYLTNLEYEQEVKKNKLKEEIEELESTLKNKKSELNEII